MLLYIASYAALIILLAMAIVGFANQNRIGEKIVSGHVYIRQHLYLLVFSVIAIALWVVLVTVESSINLLLFAWLPLNLFVSPSILGEKGLKGGVRLIPRDQLIDYSIEADGKSPVKVHFKVQGKQEPVTMKVYTKQAVELDQKLAQYFQASSAH